MILSHPSIADGSSASGIRSNLQLAELAVEYRWVRDEADRSIDLSKSRDYRGVEFFKLIRTVVDKLSERRLKIFWNTYFSFYSSAGIIDNNLSWIDTKIANFGDNWTTNGKGKMLNIPHGVTSKKMENISSRRFSTSRKGISLGLDKPWFCFPVLATRNRVKKINCTGRSSETIKISPAWKFRLEGFRQV